MKSTLTIDVEYDPDITDDESVACALDRLMETALSTPGILDEYGGPRVGEFFIARPASKNQQPPAPPVVADCWFSVKACRIYLAQMTGGP